MPCPGLYLLDVELLADVRRKIFQLEFAGRRIQPFVCWIEDESSERVGRNRDPVPRMRREVTVRRRIYAGVRDRRPERSARRCRPSLL